MKSMLLPLLAQTDSAELADIRDPVQFVSWLSVGLVALAVVALVLAFLALRRRQRRRREQAAAGPPPVAPEVWARQELERLEREAPQLDDKTFTSAAADVLRTYLERAFAVPAPERTTEEFLALIGEHPAFEGALREALDTFLNRSDLVKFARQAVAPEKRGAMLEEARAVVEEASAARLRLAAEAAATPAAPPAAPPAATPGAATS